MRTGWSCKRAAAVLGIHERRVSQSLDPALDRIARLWLQDPTLTLVTILARVLELQNQERATFEKTAAGTADMACTSTELDLLERMGRLQADRSELHPNR